MRKRVAFAVAMAVAGCAYNPPKQAAAIPNFRVIDRPVEAVWNDTLAALSLWGYPIILADKTSGVITTGAKLVPLNEAQVDCGHIMGLSYLKDRRTSTRAAYSVRLVPNGPKTEARVTTQIGGNFHAHAGAPNEELACSSLGFLEAELLNKLAAP